MTSHFTLHIWGGPNEDVVSFLPDSLASVWYLLLTAGPENCEIIPSSNQYISSNGELPALKHDGVVVAGGFQSIIKYMKEHGFDLDHGDKRTYAWNSWLLARVYPLSLYTLFISRRNFDQVTSPLIASLVPFPMQYNLTISQKQWAKEICAGAGLVDTASVEWSLSEKARNNATLSRLQEQLEGEQRGRKEHLQEAKENLRALNIAKDIFEVLADITKDSSSAAGKANGDEEPTRHRLFPFGGDEATSSDLLLLAILQISCLDTLPVPVVKTLIESQFQALDTFRFNGTEYIGRTLGTIPVSQVESHDKYSLLNFVKYWTGIN